jgi:hypothetical protein
MDQAREAAEQAGTSLQLSPGEEAWHMWYHPMNIWYNSTNKDSLRLTQMGMQMFKTVAGMPFYPVTITSDRRAGHYLYLERCITSPYYLESSRKILFSNQADAVMINLYGGDLGAYLENLRINQG